MKDDIAIIVGKPTPRNFERALGVAKVLGLNEPDKSESYLTRTYPGDDVYIRWMGRQFSEHSSFTQFGLALPRGKTMDLRPFDVEPEIKIGTYTVKFVEGGITVGCEQISIAIVDEIHKRLHR